LLALTSQFLRPTFPLHPLTSHLSSLASTLSPTPSHLPFLVSHSTCRASPSQFVSSFALPICHALLLPTAFCNLPCVLLLTILLCLVFFCPLIVLLLLCCIQIDLAAFVANCLVVKCPISPPVLLSPLPVTSSFFFYLSNIYNYIYVHPRHPCRCRTSRRRSQRRLRW
jgi:hypothetical protein